MATVEVEKMDSKFRCGNCGLQTGWVEQDAGQVLSIRELYGRLHSNNYGEVVDAVKQLVSAGPEYFVLLLRALKDPQLQELRKDVFLELSKIGDQALPLAKTVVEYLDARTTTAEVRTGAAYALAKMGKEADSTIHAWMQETPLVAWNSWPGLLFHFIGEDRSVEFLRVALTSEQGERKLWACQTIASEITHPWDALVPTLVEQVPGADEGLRSAAIDALVDIGESAVETMWEMTEARRADVRAAGLTALARYATHFPHLMRPIDGGVHDALAQLSAKLADPEQEVRVAAAVAMQQVAVAVSNDRLRIEMETANRDMQSVIAKGVQVCVVDRHGLAALRDAIHSRIAEPDKHPFAGRRIAAAYLATSPDAYADESSPVLAGLCDWHDPWRREYLEAICLAGLRARALQPGILVCTAADPSIQVLALAALGSFGAHATDEAVDRAIECLASSHPEVREAAANALGNFGSVNRTAMFSVLKLLEDDSRQVTRAACGALGKMKKLAADAVPEIVAAVDRLGETAVLALGRIGTDEARASVMRIYEQLSRSEDESEQSLGDKARAWCEKWEMLPPASGQD
jgi:HEAT repeat protein